VLKRLRSERESVIRTAKQAQRQLTISEKQHIAKLAGIQRYLDDGSGACQLAKPEVADIVSKALQFFEGKRY
jgi:REP-associated tyrosine transposase